MAPRAPLTFSLVVAALLAACGGASGPGNGSALSGTGAGASAISSAGFSAPGAEDDVSGGSVSVTAPSGTPVPSGVSYLPRVDASSLPAGSPGVDRAIAPHTGQMPGYPAGGNVGNIRTTCEFSHMNFDDPIVFPGVRNATHLHAFFGNTGIDASSTSASVAGSGNSTCRGGILNRSAYWVPAMIDTRSGRALRPGSPKFDEGVPEHAFYYKTKYSRIPFSSYQAPPPGLRMIAGDSKATSAQSTDIVAFTCGNGPVVSSIPSCPVGSFVTMHVAFPNCWDGRNLDSPDHKSHMSYAVGGEGGVCPASHPVAISNIVFNIHWAVREGDDTRAWRLSSDNYPGGPGGYSLHGDWWNGWDPATMQTQVRNCMNAAPRECGAGLLGDGRELQYVWPLLAPGP